MTDFYQLGKKKIIVLFALFSSISNAYSQIKLDENKAAQHAQEVFLNCNQYASPEYMVQYKKEIRRIEIIKINDIKGTDKQLYSIKVLPLKNKCNLSLQYDNALNFTPDNFNPLKYFLPKSNSILYYQIEGTDYVIQLNPTSE